MELGWAGLGWAGLPLNSQSYLRICFFFLFWTNGSPNTLYSCLKCILVRFSDWSKAASSSGLGGTPSLVALDLQAAWNVGIIWWCLSTRAGGCCSRGGGKVVSYLVLVLMNLSQNPCSMGSRKCLRGRRLKSLYQIPGTWKL